MKPQRRLQAVPETPGQNRPDTDGDVAAAIVRAVAAADRTMTPRWLRALLAVLACQIVALALPGLVWGDGSSPHTARHLGAFGLAYGIGLLVVARRPAKARTMLVVGQVLGATLALSAVADVLAGTVSLRAEILHLPDALSVVALWLIARDPIRRV